MAVFPSHTLARAWAVACGVSVAEAGASVQVVPDGFSVPCSGPVRVSCLFCVRLGRCSRSPGPKCGFCPGKWWPQPKQQSLF